MNIYFRLRRFQSSLLLIHFRYGSVICSHCTIVWHRTYTIMKRSTFEIGAANLHSVVTEIAPKPPFLSVNRSHIRYQQYAFRACARVILYSVNIAITVARDHSLFPCDGLYNYLIYVVKHCRNWRIIKYKIITNKLPFCRAKVCNNLK